MQPQHHHHQSASNTARSTVSYTQVEPKLSPSSCEASPMEDGYKGRNTSLTKIKSIQNINIYYHDKYHSPRNRVVLLARAMNVLK